MNTSRVINQRPKEDIAPEDMLATHAFIPSIDSTVDLTQAEKAGYRAYTETMQRNRQVKKAIDDTKTVEDYDYFASVPVSNRGSTIIKKRQKDIIKIEHSSIVDIDTRKRNKNLYPEPSSFTFALGKTFYNIKSVELVSTAIPNTDQTITNKPIQIRNNRISWENLEDEDLGRYLNKSVTSLGNYVYITITNHGLSTQVRDGRFFVKISKSTSTPNIDGRRYTEIVDANTLRIPFQGGIVATATADIDTGIPNYTVELTPGNYNASTIVTEIQKQMNLVKRRNNTGNIYHYFNVTVNLDTDVITFRSYITKQLSGSPIATTSGTGLITVTSLSHGFKSGDYVLMINVKSMGGLNGSVINGLFVITVINSDTFVYEINERASESGIGGGTTCKTGKPSDFRLIFDTANSLIVNNIGFPDEDSSETLGTSITPITTKALNISNAVINGNYITFTSNSHGLTSANMFTITSVTVGTNPILTTSTPHGLSDTDTAYIFYSFSEPQLQAFYPVTATSDTTFRLDTVEILSNTGGTGILKHGGDTIKLSNFKSVPTINENVYIIENVTTNTFEIEVGVTQIQTSSIPYTIVGTRQITINHPSHGFNTLTSIAASTATTALITTKVPHGLTGTRFTGATKATTLINTVDITVATPHGLTTSDTVLISNSVNGADIAGSYVIQAISASTFRITFVGGTSAGTCDVNTGNTVIFSDTNSTPSLSSNALGITTFYVEYVSSTTFLIQTGFSITTPGTYGMLGRSKKIAIHRVTASEIGGSTLGGIPLISIVHNYYVIDNVIDQDSYMIRVRDHATFTTSSGGSDIVVTSTRHGYRKFQSNTFTGQDDGVLYKSISLEGENYLYLVSPGLQTVFAPGNEAVGDIFSRIVLSEPPGNMLFNTFVTVPKEFNPPLRSLKDISFDIKRSDGILFNFNDTDFSMSIRVVEIVDRIADSEFSSATGTSDLY